MAERTFRSWWRSRIPDLSVAVTRFPLAVLIAGLLTLCKLLHYNGDFEQRVMGALAASFLFVVATDLYVESQRRRLVTRVLLWVLGILVIALPFWLQWDIWFSPPLLLGALLLQGRRPKPRNRPPALRPLAARCANAPSASHRRGNSGRVRRGRK